MAHFPLANVLLPANCMQVFAVMIEVVSFDYFPFTEYVDLGFTETEPWNVRFSWLGYETINIVEGLGSICILAAIGFVYILIVLLFCHNRCFINIKSPKIRSCCSRKTVFIKWLGFMQGTVFTMLICISISMRQLSILEYLNTADKVGIAVMFALMLTVVLFMLIVLFFTFSIAERVVTNYKAEHEDRNKNVLTSVRLSFKSQYIKRHGTMRRSST